MKKGQTIEEAFKLEEEFFSNHPDYSKISDRLGVGHLVHLLNSLLTVRIKQFLPGIRSKIYTMLQVKYLI